MLDWLNENLGTIIVLLVLIAIIILVILVMLKDKRKGKSSCGGNCSHCPMSHGCPHA